MKRFITMSLPATQNLKNARDDITIEKFAADKEDLSSAERSSFKSDPIILRFQLLCCQ